MINYAVMKAFRFKLSAVGTFNCLIKTQAGAYYNRICEFVSNLRNDSAAVSVSVQSIIADSEARLLTLETDITGERIRNKKLLDRLTADIVGSMTVAVNAAFEGDDKAFAECETIARQIVVGALNKRMMASDIELIEFVKLDAELAPYYFHVVGRVGKQNLFLLIGEQFICENR